MSPWGRWNLNALPANATKVTLTINTVAGYAFAARIDDANNTYKDVANNVQYKSTVEGDLVITWDLKALNINPASLAKLVFWAYDSDSSVASATIKLVSLTYEVE